uniref:ADAM metallopeptidase with thrombospondin type 1 motif 18 n=1 Tax=Junco hyemalis TaxID=40217 RepID=A0A8C5NP99_JUNHY
PPAVPPGPAPLRPAGPARPARPPGAAAPDAAPEAAVDASGSYISHDVLHSTRRKRSTQSSKSSLHYKFSAFGQELHLELKPSTILSNSFIVQVLGKDGVSNSQDHEIEQCFYQGFIRNDSTSSVAISTCVGLSGLIRTRQMEFLISPLPQRLARAHNYTSPAGHHPHVLYKRTAEGQVHGPPARPHPKSIPRGRRRTRAHPSGYRHGRVQKQHFCGRRKKYAPKPPTEETYIRSDEYGTSARFKRSSAKIQKNGSLNVETLVVADKKMLEKHGKENVTTYILTVMNMVSSLFKDGTIGSDINIIVVSLLLLEHEPGGLLINHHADQSLNSFCQWQSALVGKNGKRHDHAILLTGFDICSWKNEPCDTLGFAPISGMCSKYRSCTINEDTGLGLAFTIAHESGHNFGMIHDGEGNACRKAEGNIMSPTLTGNNGVFSWSVCSRQYLNKFLSTAQAACLIDEPKQTGQYKYPDKLPGQIYDADTQCKWQFGMKAKLCNLSFVKDICKSLWCHKVGHRCETKFMPAAEGTACGISMWCRRGQCVQYGEHGPKPVHGQWSAWSQWSECTRTCGGGVTYQERHCNNPKVQPCSGRDALGVMFHLCPRLSGGDSVSAPSLSDLQVFFQAMICCLGIALMVFPLGLLKILSQACFVSVYFVCILFSSSSFRLTESFLLPPPHLFFFFLKQPPNIPLQILLQGKNPGISWEYTFAKSSIENKTSVRKHSYSWVTVQSECSATCGGGHITAKAICLEDHRARVNASFCGPRTKPLTETKLCNTNPCPAYWSAGEWSTCSKSCGGGQQSRLIQCVQKRAFQREEVVAHSLCPVSTPAQVQVCSAQDCPPEWSPGPWSQCSKTCGRGIKKRDVYCKSPGSPQVKILPESMCSTEPKPESQQTCVLGRCPKNDRLQWVISSWSECSASCGPGLRQRELKCGEKSIHGKLVTFPQRRCRNIKKPNTSLEEACNKGACPSQTLVSATQPRFCFPSAQCTVTCGGGVQTRSVQCLRQGRPAAGCLPQQKPAVLRACNTNFCPVPVKRDDPSCVDFFTWCHLVPQHGVCNHKFYGKQCCKSCTKKN